MSEEPLTEEISGRSRKSPAAFRTISEVSDELDVPQHVLRFWETKFSQIRPMKRAGGRRYYRPSDVDLLRRISRLLYHEGYTIKGVQRLLREKGGKIAGPALAYLGDDADDPELIRGSDLAGVEPEAEEEAATAHSSQQEGRSKSDFFDLLAQENLQPQEGAAIEAPDTPSMSPVASLGLDPYQRQILADLLDSLLETRALLAKR